MGTTEDTSERRRELYADRWSGFGESAGVKQVYDKPTVEQLQQMELFQDYDASFLERQTQDLAFVEWERDATLFEEGSYLDLAFFIIEGEVELFLEDQQRKQQRSSTRSEPIFDFTRMLESEEASSGPEAASSEDAMLASNVFEQQVVEKKEEDSTPETTFLSTMDFNLDYGQRKSLGPGEIFGEIGALNGWPQSVTARTATPCTLLQIRLPALRALKKKSDAFKEWIDTTYRKRELNSQLQSTPLFSEVDPGLLAQLAERVDLVSREPDEVLAEEGGDPDAIYLVRSGFLKLTTQPGDEPLTVSYLSKGMTLGEVELLIEKVDGWQYTVTSVGYSELVRIDRADLVALMKEHPKVGQKLWQAAVDRIKETGYAQQHPEKGDVLDFGLERGLMQGNSMLVIDLDVCTRCDDCVRGCAETHGGRPRFVREGEKYENFLVTRACIHCEDPACLVGCPTGAIHRTNVGEVVDIDDDLCIGCGNCANKCPYDAITMHDTGEEWPDDALPSYLQGRDREVASKCDLCYESESGPACVNNCPHSCAFRVGSMDEFLELTEAEQT